MPRTRKLRKAELPMKEEGEAGIRKVMEPQYVPTKVEKWANLALRGEVLLESFKFLPYSDLTQCQLASHEFHQLINANRERFSLFQVEMAKMDWTINPHGKWKNKRTEAYFEVDVEPQHCLQLCAAHWQKQPADALGGKLIVFDEDDYPNSVQFEMGVKQELVHEKHMVCYSEESKRGRIFWINGRNVAPRKFVPHLLHFFHHLRHPHVFFHHVTLYPFEMAFWHAVDSSAVRNYILCRHMDLESSGQFTSELFAWLLDFSRTCVRTEHLKWDVDLELAGKESEQSQASTSSTKKMKKGQNGGEGAKAVLDQLVEWIVSAGENGSFRNLEISITSGLEEFLDSLLHVITNGLTIAQLIHRQEQPCCFQLAESSPAPPASVPSLTLCFVRYREELPQVPCANRLHPYFVRKETQWKEGKYNMQLEAVSTYEIPHKGGEDRSLKLRMKLMGKSIDKKEWERRHGASTRQ